MITILKMMSMMVTNKCFYAEVLRKNLIKTKRVARKDCGVSLGENTNLKNIGDLDCF
jgi:hypothetical protein